MKFYELSAKSFQWHTILERNKLHEVIVPINKDQFVSEKEFPLRMELVDSYKNIKEWTGETPFVDIIRWSSDFTLGGNKPKKGVCIIISEKIKKVLEKYKLPSHSFYPVEMSCKYVKEKRNDYFLFHITGSGVIDEYVDYKKCTFNEYTRNEDDEKILVKKYPEGLIKNNKEYVDVLMQRSSVITTGSYEDIDIPGEMYPNDFNYNNKVFKYNYDVLWGIPNVIYVSEEIKNELTTLDCENLFFIEIPYNMVRPFEYEENRNKES